MNMTTTEHLNLIKRECERLLALSSDLKEQKAEIPILYQCGEAGWQSTIIAINTLLNLATLPTFVAHSAQKTLNEIITAWPLEILTKEGQ